MHGFLSLLLHCGFLRLTGDLKALSLVNHVVECRRKRPFFSPEWRFGEASECGLEAWKDFYFKLFFSFEKLSKSKKKNFRTLDCGHYSAGYVKNSARLLVDIVYGRSYNGI